MLLPITFGCVPTLSLTSNFPFQLIVIVEAWFIAGTSFADVYIFNTKCCVIGKRINTIIMIIIEPSTGSKTFSYFVHQSLGVMYKYCPYFIIWWTVSCPGFFWLVPRSLLGVSIGMWLPKHWLVLDQCESSIDSCRLDQYLTPQFFPVRYVLVSYLRWLSSLQVHTLAAPMLHE